MWVLTLRQYLVDAHPGIGMLLELVQKLVGSQHLIQKKRGISIEMKRIEKLEKQVDRFSRHILKEIEMFENTLEAIAIADEKQELKDISLFGNN